MNKNIADYLQNQIIKYCWYHYYYDQEINNNGKLILWKQWLLLVSKRWFHYITQNLNNRYIINRPYEFISNFQSSFSINQLPPTHLEITSNMYIKLLKYLNNDKLKYLFFSNIQFLKFTFDSGHNNFMSTESISIESYIYLFYNFKNITDIEINFYSPDGKSRKCIDTSNILECYVNLVNQDYIEFKKEQLSLIQADQDNEISEIEIKSKFNKNLALINLKLHVVGSDKKILQSFKKLKLFNLKYLKIEYYYNEDNYINQIIESLHQVNLLDGLFITYYVALSLDGMEVILKKLISNNKLLKSLKEFKISFNTRSMENDYNHSIYITIIQLLKEMVNLKNLYLFLDRSDFEGYKLEDLLQLSRVQLIQYLLNENTSITQLDTNLFDDKALKLISDSFLRCKQFKLISKDNDTNFKYLLPLFSKDTFKIIMLLIPPSFSLSILKTLQVNKLVIEIFGQTHVKNNNPNLNEMVGSIIKKNTNLQCVDITISNFSNLKCNVNEKVITQLIESFDANKSLRYLSFSIKCLENTKEVLTKINKEIEQNNQNRIIWLESSIIAYPGKTTINRNLNLYIIKK